LKVAVEEHLEGTDTLSRMTRAASWPAHALRLTLIVLGSAAYFGLAVLGRGGFAAFFAHPALIALALVGLALAGAAVFAGGNLSPACARIAPTAGSSPPSG
jgi:hypothetical protein